MARLLSTFRLAVLALVLAVTAPMARAGHDAADEIYRERLATWRALVEVEGTPRATFAELLAAYEKVHAAWMAQPVRESLRAHYFAYEIERFGELAIAHRRLDSLRRAFRDMKQLAREDKRELSRARGGVHQYERMALLTAHGWQLLGQNPFADEPQLLGMDVWRLSADTWIAVIDEKGFTGELPNQSDAYGFLPDLRSYESLGYLYVIQVRDGAARLSDRKLVALRPGKGVSSLRRRIAATYTVPRDGTPQRPVRDASLPAYVPAR